MRLRTGGSEIDSREIVVELSVERLLFLINLGISYFMQFTHTLFARTYQYPSNVIFIPSY